MKFRYVLILVGCGVLFVAASCSRSLTDPEVLQPAPVLDTGWRQTGYRSPPKHSLYLLQQAGNTLVGLDSANGLFAYQRERGWWEVAMPKDYRAMSSKSFIGVGDTFYFGSDGRKGITWDPASDSMTTWTIPGPNHPDSSWIQGFGTYQGNLVASLRVISQPSEAWIRVDGNWRPLGKITQAAIPSFNVFYQASDGTLFGGGRNGLYFLGTDSIWTEIKPLMACAKPSCSITGVSGITEYDGKGWVSTQGAYVAQFDVASRTYIDTMNNYRVVADSVMKLVGFGTFFGMLHHGDYLFLPGEELAPGVWVWNRKRNWFQHVPLLRKGVTYYTNNYASTYGLAVLDDTLYASNSHGIVKFAIADIAADLARDTLPWPGTP